MRTLFDKSAGADLDARSAPGGRGAGMHRVNPTLSAKIQEVHTGHMGNTFALNGFST